MRNSGLLSECPDSTFWSCALQPPQVGCRWADQANAPSGVGSPRFKSNLAPVRPKKPSAAQKSIPGGSWGLGVTPGVPGSGACLPAWLWHLPGPQKAPKTIYSVFFSMTIAEFYVFFVRDEQIFEGYCEHPKFPHVICVFGTPHLFLSDSILFLLMFCPFSTLLIHSAPN